MMLQIYRSDTPSIDAVIDPLNTFIRHVGQKKAV